MIGFREALAKFEEAKVKRDKNGKFANKYGNVKEGRLASAMVRAVKTSGGFTLDDRTGRGVPDGYSVGVFPQYSGVFDVKQFSKGAAKKWLAQHRKLIKDDRIMVGGWHDTDTGKVWLDLVRVYPKNQKDIALGVGRKRNQIAIADLGAISRGDWDNAIINTGGTGVAKRGGRFFLLKGSATPEELFNAVHNRTITKLFSEILKAKSQYRIGKHPNSHRKRGSAALPETVVGEGHDGLFVHGTSSKGAKAIVANGPSLSSGSNEHGANEFGAALYLSEHDRGQQALHFSAGARDKLVEFTLAKGTRLLDVRGDMARTARHSLDGGQGVLKFKKTPEWHEDFVEHSLGKVTDQYKKYAPDWENRVRGSLTIGGKDFDVNSYTSRLKTYVKDKGMAGVRFHDETVLFDASVVVKSRVMSTAEKRKVTARTAATAHERPKGSLFEKREAKLFSEILKAKSQYRIGKHPNSHRKRGGSNAAEGEEPADTQEGIKAGRSFYNSEYKRLNSTPFTKKDQLEVVRHLASAGFGQTALFKVYVQQLKNRMALGSKSPDGSVLNFYSSLYRNKPEMNTTLRTRRLQDLQDDPADGKKGVGAGRELLAWRSTLDYMLNTYGTPTKKPMLALRGVHSKDALEVKTPTGVRYLDRGFTSVSVNGSHREFGDTSVMVRIPKGVRILPVERQGFDFGELLLPRNAEYRTGAFHNIRSVRPTPKRNKTLPDRATERYVELLGVRNIKKAESFDELFKAFNEADHPRDEDGQFASKMSSEDAEELRGYSTTGGTYSKVNAGLRSNKDMSSDPTVAALDRAFATHAEAAPSVLYRGMSGYELEELDLRVGREFTDPAFVSTTSQKKSATKFATAGEMKLNGEAVGILFKINAKSAPSLDMNRFSNYEEQETLLNRGTRFRVTSVKPGVAGRTLASVTLTVVPNR